MKSSKPPAIDLYLGDCVEGIRSHVAAGSVDVVITSPPYNLNIRYNSYEDDRNWNTYLEWTDTWAREVRNAISEGGSFFLNVAGSPKTPLLPHVLIDRLVNRSRLFELQNTIHWIKSIAIPDGKSVRQIGHYKPINSHRFLNDCHEHVFHLTPTGRTPIDRKALGVPYAHKSNIARWAHSGGADLKCRGNAWFIPYKTISSRRKHRPHPATFPAELASFCIRLHGRGSTLCVMDPFMGIGHSARAAVTCGVGRFIGFEIDRGYLNAARKELRALGAKPTSSRI